MAETLNDFTKEFTIEIVHVPSGKKVEFGAFLNSFSDTVKPNIKSTTVYGRMDPIINYQNTTRTIDISFTVPASSLQDAAYKTTLINQLRSFQYPSYRSIGVVSGIGTPPICKVKFNNLIQESDGYLYGYFSSVAYAPVNDSGYLISNNNMIYAKEYKISLNFTVLHTKPLGWSGQNFSLGNGIKGFTAVDFSDTALGNLGTDFPEDSSIDESRTPAAPTTAPASAAAVATSAATGDPKAVQAEGLFSPQARDIIKQAGQPAPQKSSVAEDFKRATTVLPPESPTLGSPFGRR